MGEHTSHNSVSVVLTNLGKLLPDLEPLYRCCGLQSSAPGLAIIADLGSRSVRLSGASGSRSVGSWPILILLANSAR
jgi:hypothetical protein